MRKTARTALALLLTGSTLFLMGSASAWASHEADGPTYEPSISSTGRYVAFRSYDTDLVPGDSNEADDVFLHDDASDGTERISLGPSGVEANFDSFSPSLSPDARYVAFVSEATNLVGGDTNGVADVFVRDRATGSTQRVSLGSADAQANGASDAPAISSSGRYVVFSSQASNLASEDTNGAEDIFLRDRVAGTTRLISRTASGAQANGDSREPAMSGDGRFVVFESVASNIVPDSNDVADVFVHDTSLGSTRRASVDASGGQIGPAWCPHSDMSGTTGGGATDYVNCGYDAGAQAAISADGRFVAFVSHIAGVFSGGRNGQPDVYVYDQSLGRTVTRASFGAEGTGGGGEQPDLSADGRYVVFASDTALGSNDRNGVRDIWEFDRLAGQGFLLSYDDFLGIQANGASEAPAISADGTFTAFSSYASNFTIYNHEIEDLFVHEWVTVEEEDPCAEGTGGGVCTTSRTQDAPAEDPAPKAKDSKPDSKKQADAANCTNQFASPDGGARSFNTMTTTRKCKIHPRPRLRRTKPRRRRPDGCRSDAPPKTEKHHIATNKHPTKWTPKFRKEIFGPSRLGMNNEANLVAVPGHRGPHPEAYHQIVYDTLIAAIKGRRMPARQAALKAALNGLRARILNPADELNHMVTRSGKWAKDYCPGDIPPDD